MGEKKYKLAIINAIPYGSTGRIVSELATVAQKNGFEVAVFNSWTKRRVKRAGINVGSFFGKAIHVVLGRITGLDGFFSVFDTLRIIRTLSRIKPDVVHLHILHSYSINLGLLFRFLKNRNCKVIWTMHDCWAITGHCPHFSLIKCSKWKSGCSQCTLARSYPKSLMDSSKFMWRYKKNRITVMDSLIIVNPSGWMKSVMSQSFLSRYNLGVIYNGIDTSIFNISTKNYRDELEITKDEFVVIGVAFEWSYRKGIDVFVDLASRLPKEYRIILVGVSTEYEQILPPNIISVKRTDSIQELVDYYNTADVFVNPTREEAFGLVNVEALACGIPVVTFDTGGAPECVDDSCARVVKCNDVDGLIEAIEEFRTRRIDPQICRKRALQFDKKNMLESYMQLYFECCGNEKEH